MDVGLGAAVKSIHLLRHAKSSWKEPELDDHDRPLSKRGRRVATALAHYLQRSPLAPDVVLCSSAARARQTLDVIGTALRPSKVVLDRTIYEAGPRELLKLLRQLPESAESVLLIGHNPALHELAVTLAGVKSVGKLPSLTEKFPTAALASFQFDGSWTALQAHQTTVIGYLAPAAMNDAH